MSSSDPNEPQQAGQPGYSPNPPNPSYPPYPPYPGYPAGPTAPSSYYSPPQAPPPGYGHNYIPIGYPTPYYPQMPPASPPQKRSNRTLIIVLGVIGAVLLIGCVAGTLLVISVVNAVGDYVGPIAAATQFCVDEENQDYTAAYQYLSLNVRETYSEDQFIAYSQSRDSTYGNVTLCEVDTNNQVQIKGSTATLSLTDTFNDGKVVGPVTLVKVGNSWYLDSADSSLRFF